MFENLSIFLILQQWLEHEQFSEVFKHCYHDNVFSFFFVKRDAFQWFAAS